MLLIGVENFIFVNNNEEKYVSIKDVPNLFNEDDLYTQIESFSILDLDADGENEIILYIIASSNDMGGLLILHQIDNNIYGYKTNYREITLLKEDSTFFYSDPTGIKENGIAIINSFSENGYSINKIAYTTNTNNSNAHIINNKSVSEEEFNLILNEQNSKKDVDWYKFAEDLN